MLYPPKALLKSRMHGALYGLAVGDALGASWEFNARGTYAVSGEMEPAYPFGLPAGSWTDDTSMMLCMAASLVEKKEFDWVDCAKRFIRWYHDGYMSVSGACFDIGMTTSTAIAMYAKLSSYPPAPSANPATNASGNGSIMRLACVPIFYHNHLKDPNDIYDMAATSSKITHSSPLCIDGCILMSAYIVGFLHAPARMSLDEKKAAVLSPTFALTSERGQQFKIPLKTPEMIEIHNQASYKTKPVDKIRTTGFVLHTLEAALWALWRAKTFEEGMMLLLPLGEDVDTICAVYGELAGACFGVEAIPDRWISQLQKKAEMLDPVFEPLVDLATSSISD